MNKFSFTYHHLGVAVNNIEASKISFSNLSFTPSSIKDVIDELQNIKLAFLENNGTIIELVQGLGKNHLIKGIIEKNGVSPYHTAYIVNDLIDSREFLKTKRFRPITAAIEAKAFHNSQIQFFHNSDTGIIELIEMEQ